MKQDSPGIVLNTYLENALLASAIEEGLVDNPVESFSDRDPDYIFEGVRRSDGYEIAKRLAWEQLMISGKVYVKYQVPKHYKRAWHGELFEKGVIVLPEEEQPEPTVLPSLPPGCVMAMLKQSTGRDWQLSEIDNTINTWSEWNDPNSELYENFGDNPQPMRILSQLLTESMKTQNRGGKKIECYEKYNAAQSRFTEIEKVFIEAARITSLARKHSALCGIPCELEKQDTSIDSVDDSAPRHLEFLEVIDKQLGAIPIGRSLKTCVDLTDTDEAIAFRLKLLEWTKGLKEGRISSLENIRNEIFSARSHLETRANLVSLGKWCTAIGAVVAFHCSTIPDPYVAGAGCVISVVGGIALAGEKLLTTNNEWTSFVLRR